MNKNIVMILCAIVFIYVSCGDGATYTVEVIDGVRHVHNIAPLIEGEGNVHFEFVQKIGVLEGEDKNYIFFKPADVTVDNEGYLYVLDNSSCQVKKFDRNGKHILTFGDKGQGPGEFERPAYIEIGPNNMLYILDNRTIHTFTSEGKYISRLRLEEFGGPFTINSENQIIIDRSASSKMRFTEDNYKNSLMGILDNEGNVITTFGTPLLFDIPQLQAFANFLDIAHDGENNIYVAFVAQNRIEKYSLNGQLIWIADRPINFELVYRTETRPNEVRGEIVESEYSVVSVVSQGVGIDHNNRIWVLTILKQQFEEDMNVDDLYEFDVFNSDGILLYTISPPDIRWDNVSIYNDRIYFVDPFQEMCVYEYKIVEN
ncbi:NHL repeat-containing protein [candidate division KSB1 bacterium]